MKFIGKLLAVLIALIIAVVAALAVFIHYYLTDERIKSLVIPQAEEALGRSVSIGAIDVGIFSGITINDFAVKEADSQDNFIKTNKFVLSYNLFPLLQKKLIVSEILLDRPSINVIRDKSGAFNFDTIALLEKSGQAQEKAAKEDSSTPAKMSIPIALTVERIKITAATLSFTDLKNELPKTDATVNLNVGLDIGTDLSAIKYKGDMDLAATAKYDKASLAAKIDSQFSQDDLKYSVDLDIDQEKVRLEGTVKTFKTPDIVCDITSKKLNIDRLLALAAILPKTETSKEAQGAAKPKEVPEEKSPPTAIAASLPKGLHAQGLISIQQALYKKLVIEDFRLEHDLTAGVFTIKDLSAKTAGGSIKSKMKVDLNNPDPHFNGSASANSIEVSSLGTGLQQGFADIFSGALQGTINFDGAGMTSETIKKTLSADASYALTNGGIKNTDVTKTIADLTGIRELQDVTFKDMSGTLKLVKGGDIKLVSDITAADFGVTANGTVNLDGKMDLPLLVTLSENLSSKLDPKGSVTKFMANKKGETELPLKLTGPVNSPKTTLDSAGVQEQVKETLKKKAVNELDRFLQKQQDKSTQQKGDQQTAPQSPKEPVTKFLKGIFD